MLAKVDNFLADNNYTATMV
jgi:hypothetical protein